MSRLVLVLTTEWPWIRNIKDVRLLLAPPTSDLKHRDWVILPDGRVGYVDHQKNDGNVGVRPVDPNTGEDLPNSSKHWTDEQRKRIPEEIAILRHKTRPAEKHELPYVLR